MIPAAVAALACDVDGVLTDGRLLYPAEGEILKSFDVRDGHALVALRRAGVALAWITGRDDATARRRAAELGCRFYVADRASGKGPVVRAWLAEIGVPAAATVFVGDDLPDLAAFAEVGWPVAVADAPAVVRRAARRVTRTPGGRGAIAEVAGWILARRGTV